MSDLLNTPPVNSKESGVLTAREHLERIRGDNAIGTSVEYGLQQNPDAAAKDQYNARQFNLPLGFVQENSADVDLAAKRKEIIKKIQGTQILKEMMKDPRFAAIANDDIDALRKVEESTYAGNYMRGVGTQYAIGMSNLYEGIKMQWTDLLQSVQERINPDAKEYIAELEQRKRESIETYRVANEILEEARPQFSTEFAEAFYSGVGSFARNVPSLAIGVLGSPAAGLGLMGLMTETESYLKYRERGGTRGEALTGAMLEGAIEIATEKMPMDYFVNKLGKTGFRRFMAGLLGREMFTETMATVGQELVDTMIANPEKTLEDYKNELPRNIYHTLVATLAHVGLAGSINLPAQYVAGRYGNNVDQAQTAIDAQRDLDRQVQSALEAKLRTRGPEGQNYFKRFLDQTLGAEEAVYMASDDAQAFFQSHPDLLPQFPDETRESVTEALSSNADVAIPKADYLTYMTDFHAEIRDILRNDMDGMSVMEANRWAETGQQQFEVAAEKILQDMDRDSEFRQSLDRVTQSIEQQLLSAGQAPQNVKRMVALPRAFYTVTADKMGITPEQLIERHPELRMMVAGAPMEGVVGLTQEEQTEYQRAVAKGLPMDQESRMQRAQEMGFDTEQVWYHGTTSDIQGFEEEYAPYRGGLLAFFTSSKEFANDYSTRTGQGANVLPVYLKYHNAFDHRTDAWLAREFYEETGGLQDDADINRILMALDKENEDIDIMGPAVRPITADEFTALVKEGSWDALEASDFVEWLYGYGYDAIKITENGAENIAVFDPSQIRSINAAFDPDFSDSANLLAQGPVDTARWDQYRAEQEARPIKGEVSQPIRNKDGSYRRNAQGDITGAPVGVKTEEDITAIVEANVDRMETDLAQMPESADWYEVSGQAIRDVTRGDPELAEKMIRMMAVLSAANQVGGNATGAIKAIYQLSRWIVGPNPPPAAGRFPNEFADAMSDILAAKDFSWDLPKVEAKVMSFYRNLWDATFESEKYENAVTMDMWMARLYGYQLDTFGPAQYRFATLVTNQIREQYNAKHGTDLKNRQVQAALWVYARNRERFGEEVGAGVALPDRNAFDTYIDRAKQNITVEAVPSVDSGLFPEIHLATPEQRGEYTRQAIGLLLNSNGENELMQRLGIPLYVQQPSEGSFEGVVNPNEIITIVSDKKTIEGTRPGNKQTKEEYPGPGRAKLIVEEKHANRAAKALQYIYTQDGVPWFQLDPTATGAKQGVAIHMKGTPDTAMEEAFLEHLSQFSDADFTRIGDSFFLLNFNAKSKDNPKGITNAQFKKQVIEAYEKYDGPGADLLDRIEDNVKARSNYLAQDWSDVEAAIAESESYFRDEGLGDLLPWLRDRREAVARLQADFRDQELSALYQGPGVAPFDLAFDYVLATPDQLREWEEAHKPEEAIGYMQETIEGKREPRRPPSVRRDADGNYTVIDGRSGTTAAIKLGYTQIPVRVIDDVRDEETGQVVPVTKAAEEFYKKAGRMKDKFDKAMEKIALEFNGVWKDTNLKGRARAMYKIDHNYKGDPNRIKDILRGTIAVNRIEDIEPALERVVGEYVPADKVKTSILRALSPNLSGYKDVNVVIDFNGVKAEVQINTREMLVAKHFGHDLYNAYREIAEKDELTDQEAAMVRDLVDIEIKLYRDAYALAEKSKGKATPAQALAVVHARAADVDRVNAQYGLSINFRKSDLDKILPLWMAEPTGKFRGGSESHALQVLKDLSRTTGTPSTSSRVESLGISKSDISNIFTSESIVPQTQLFAPGNRGQIQFTEQGALITLLENADLSTFLHESGHFFFEAYKVLARENEAIRADMDALLKFVGVDSLEAWESMSLEERRAGHEKVARAFERYLFEGKAPSLELQSLFDTFIGWLKQVYRNLRNLNVPITDEVREVFDRMLATDDQIRARKVANAYAPLFGSIEEAGATAQQWQEYQSQNEMQQRRAESDLARRSLKDMQWLSNARSRLLREMQAAHDRARREMRSDVAQDVRNEPVYHTMQFLRTGETFDAEGNPVKLEVHKLNREEFRENYPDVSLNEVRGMTEDGGVPADLLAEQLGWSSGDEMIQTILRAEKESDRVDRLTDERMLAEYGDLTNPEQMEAAVEEALHSEAHTRFLHTELRMLDKGIGNKNVLNRAAKAWAQQIINRKKVKDIKPSQYSRAEARAGRMSQQALMDGDRESAADHKRAQVLQSHLFRSANKAKQDVEKAVRYFKRIVQGRLKNIDPDYLDQMYAQLEKYNFRQASLKEIERRKSLVDWVAAQEKMGFSPEIDPRLLSEAKRQHYKDTPVEELMALYDTVKNIEHLGRLKDKLIREAEKRRMEEIEDELVPSIEKHARGKNKVRLESNSWWASKKEGIDDFFAMHRKFASFAREMDGGDYGPMWDYFIAPMNERGNWEASQRAISTEALHDLFAPILKGENLRKKMFIQAINNSLSREGRLTVALNWGNEGNRQRIMDGYNWSPQQVQAILDTLTEQEWQFVQGVWDYIDSFWPQIAEKEKRVTGVMPEKVDRAPVDTKFGQFEGGYYPIMYDPRKSGAAAGQEAADILKQAELGKVSRATTRRGHTKARLEKVDRAPRLDLGGVFRHVDQVVHDLAWHEWLIDANRLIRRPAIDQAIREGYGPEIVRSIRKAIEDIAIGEMPAQNAFERGINHLRTGVTIAGMGWSLWTSLLQPLGLTQSMARIGPKWVGKGLAQWLGDAARMENTAKKIYEKSTFMRLRARTMQREINEIQNKVSAGKSVEGWQASFFYMIQKLQLVADIPTWLGEYNKQIENGRDEKTAVAMADQAVLDSQSGGQIKDLAQIQRGGPLQKLFTNFYSYFNMTWNLTAESWAKNVRRAKSPLDVGRFAVDFLLLYSLPATLSALMREALRGDCGFDDEECITQKVMQENLSYMAGVLVGAREMSGMLQGFYGYEGPAGARFFAELGNLGQQIAQGEVDKALIKSANQTAGILFHYPAAQVQRSAEGLIAVIEGETEGVETITAPLFGPPR